MKLHFTQIDPVPKAITMPLEARGWTCVHTPFREVVYLQMEPIDFQSYDCLIITSKQAARWLLKHHEGALPPLAVVGGSSNRLLKEHNCLFGDQPPASADMLVQALLKRGLPPKCLFLKGANARDVIEQGLPSANLHTVIVYQTQKIKKNHCDYGSGMVYFQAPSTVADFYEMYQKQPELIGAIGETTASAIRDMGWSVDFKPTRPELPFLAQQLPAPANFNLRT